MKNRFKLRIGGRKSGSFDNNLINYLRVVNNTERRKPSGGLTIKNFFDKG